VDGARQLPHRDDQEDSLVPGAGRVTRVSAEISELHLGVRKVWDRDLFFRPFAVGGIALVTAELQKLGVEEEGDGVGFWVNAGINLALTAHFNLGAEVRYSRAKVDLAGKDRQAGVLTVGALAGFHW
jgi:opacity protein-like surface antigen